MIRNRVIGWCRRVVALAGKRFTAYRDDMTGTLTPGRDSRMVRHSGRASAECPKDRAGERPALFADRIGEWYVSRRTTRLRKAHGLYTRRWRWRTSWRIVLP